MTMRNQRRSSVTIIALVMVILMLLGLFAGIFASLNAQGRSLTDIDREINDTRNQMNDLQERRGPIQNQMAEIAARLTVLRAEEDSYLEELSVLEDQLRLLEEQIALTEEQIDLYKRMVAAKELRVEEAERREAEQLELYIQRIRTMEERGSHNYLQIILRARSFSDLITRIHDAGEIMAADQRIAEALERYRIAVQEYKDDLLADQEELEILIAQLEADQRQLETERAEVERRIRELEARIQAQEVELAELYAEEQRMAAEIDRMTRNLGNLDAARLEALRELERQVAAGNPPGYIGSGARPGTGSFAWPSAHTTRVVSGFGYRIHPISGDRRHHNGIDIAAPGINGTNVLAAASGVVISSRTGWNGGFGNYVLIQHAGGYTTLYAHNSANLVSAGTNVVQGQAIARVGSTGSSTGPHIHFEIRLNGRLVDPMRYFS